MGPLEVARILGSGHLAQIPYFGHVDCLKTIVFILLLSLLYFFYTLFILFYTFLYFLNGFGYFLLKIIVFLWFSYVFANKALKSYANHWFLTSGSCLGHIWSLLEGLGVFQ